MSIDESVTVTDYCQEWPELYKEEKERLRQVLGDLAIGLQHFGSTSVPGLSAKPIIDILIGIESFANADTVTEQLVQLGYQALGEAGVPGRLYYRKRSSDDYNAAVVEWGGEHWINNLLLRDYLRQHPAAAVEYAGKKQEAIVQGKTTLLSYSADKAEYMLRLLDQARHWAASKSPPG